MSILIMGLRNPGTHQTPSPCQGEGWDEGGQRLRKPLRTIAG